MFDRGLDPTRQYISLNLPGRLQEAGGLGVRCCVRTSGTCRASVKTSTSFEAASWIVRPSQQDRKLSLKRNGWNSSFPAIFDVSIATCIGFQPYNPELFLVETGDPGRPDDCLVSDCLVSFWSIQVATGSRPDPEPHAGEIRL